MFEPLPALMRLQRQKLDLTLDAASALSGVSRSRVAALEKGDDNISLDLLVKLANAYGMTEVRIGGLRVAEANRDFRMLVAAAEALETAGRIVEQVEALRADLERVSGPIAELLEPVITSRKPSGKSPGSTDGIERLARLIARRRHTA